MKRSMILSFLIIGLLLVIYVPAVSAASGIDVSIKQIQGSLSKDYSKITISYSVENTGSVSFNEPIAMRYNLVSVGDQDVFINLGSDIIRKLPSIGHNAPHTVTFSLDSIPRGRYYLQVIFDPDNDLTGKIKLDYTFSSRPNTIYLPTSITIPTPVTTKIKKTPTLSNTVKPTSTKSTTAISVLEQSYSDEHFSLKYPSDWTYKTNHLGLSEYDEVTVFSPGEVMLVDVFGRKSNTVRTLDETQAAYIEYYKKTVNDFSLVSTEKVTFSGNPAIALIYTRSSPTGVKGEVYHVFSIINLREYNVAFVSDPELFDKNLPLGREIIDSIEIPEFTTMTPSGSSLEKTYSDNHFSLKYPSGWTYKAENTIAGKFGVYVDSENIRIFIVADARSTKLSLDELEGNWLKQSNKNIMDFKLISAEKTLFSGNPAILNVCTWTDSTQTKVKTYMVMTLVDKHLLKLHITTSPDEYEAKLPLAKEIIESVVVKEI